MHRKALCLQNIIYSILLCFSSTLDHYGAGLINGLARSRQELFPLKNINRNEHALEAQYRLKPFDSIPGPRKLPFFGHLYLFNQFGPYSFERLYDAYFYLYEKHGPILRLDLGITIVALFRADDVDKLINLGGRYPRRPVFEALKHYRLENKHLFNSAGLITQNGPEWWELRKAVNFMMKPPFVGLYFSSQLKIAEDFVKRIRSQRTADLEIDDFLKELYRYTEESVGQVCFGTRLGLLDTHDQHADSISSKLTAAADDTLDALADTLLSLPLWRIFKTSSYKKLVTSQEFFRKFALECLAKAKESARSENRKDDPALQFLLKLTENPELDEKDIALLMTEIFSAGIDATGNTLGFLLYNLARNAEVQEKLYNEISAHASSGQPLLVDVLQNVPYLRACVKESHRLTPTAGGVARILDEDTEFCGYHVPANVLCISINPVMCRQTHYFKDPDDFKPERWLNESPKEKPHPHCVLPFSHGVRRCVGQRIAEQEIFLCIFKIIEKFRVEYYGPNIGSTMRLQLTPDEPLKFKFVDRQMKIIDFARFSK